MLLRALCFVRMTIMKVVFFYLQFPKLNSYPVKLIYYTHAVALSQPKPCLIIIGSSPVKSKIVDTS